MAAEAAVELRSVTRKFGAFEALAGMDLRVARGEMYGLLGPNGAGKTTAIRILCGLDRATSGEARALGTRVPDRALLPRIGYMPQETALYHDLTVAENLRLFGDLYGLDAKRLAQRVDELLAFVDLSKWRDAVVSTLSGGMRHRTSLVVALLHDPDLLILDEPTVGVDPELRATFWEYFQRLARDGRTLLITTHYIDEARNCDRVGFLLKGKLIAEGTPVEVMQRAGVSDLEKAFLHFAKGGRR